MSNGGSLVAKLGFLAVACGVSLPAQQQAADRSPAEVLREATAKVRERMVQSRRYTCVETLERNTYQPAAATLERPCAAVLAGRGKPTLDMVLRRFATDRLRLDVTLARQGEMYSWVGASHFENAGIGNVVKGGPIGSGAFADLLDIVFLADVERFDFEGRQVVNGIDAMQYAFQVAEKGSHYAIQENGAFVPTAYSGTVWINRATGDVVRIRVVTAELEARSGACQIDKTLDFGITQIGDAPLLLPTFGRERFIAPNGVETENDENIIRPWVRSHCRLDGRSSQRVQGGEPSWSWR